MSEKKNDNGERALGRVVVQKLPWALAVLGLAGGGSALGLTLPGLGTPSTGTVASIDARLARIETLLDSIDRMLRDHEIRLRNAESLVAEHERELDRKAARQ